MSDEEKRRREILGITSSQTEVLEELSENELDELRSMTFEERRNYLDEVRSLIERGGRERKKPTKPPQEDLEEKLKEERRRHWFEEERSRQGWRFQFERAEELEKEKREEFERKYGKRAVAVVNPPLRREKVISPTEEHGERSPPLTFREPPPRKPRYITHRRKRAGE